MSHLNLPIAQYRVQARALEAMQLPEYTGSAWRGVFGHALKSVVCVTGKPSCEGCLLYRNCVYSYIFETPPPADTQVMRKYTAAPHPFVLQPDPAQQTSVAAGESLYVDMTLFGHANQHLPYLLYTFEKAGERGLGGSHARFEVVSMSQQVQGDWQCIYQAGNELQALAPQMPEIPPCPEGEVLVTFHTPHKIRLQGQDLKANNLDFYGLFSMLMRRVSLLQQFHGEAPLVLNFKDLSTRARSIPIIKRDLYWKNWARYSSRQKTLVKMGGLMGSLVLDGRTLKDFWPILYLGQFTHVGKGTAMGLGRFSLTHDT